MADVIQGGQIFNTSRFILKVDMPILPYQLFESNKHLWIKLSESFYNWLHLNYIFTRYEYHSQLKTFVRQCKAKYALILHEELLPFVIELEFLSDLEFLTRQQCSWILNTLAKHFIVEYFFGLSWNWCSFIRGFVKRAFIFRQKTPSKFRKK